MMTTDPTGVHPPPDRLRSDAARNQQLIWAAARRIIDRDGPRALTMDAVAREAEVGKGTVYRRFGNRTGLMHGLLDHSETELQQGFLSGEPPLGPGAEPLERLIAFGRARLAMTCDNIDLLLETEHAPTALQHPARRVAELHVRILLQQLGFDDGTDVIVNAVLAPLTAQSVHHLVDDLGYDVAAIADSWEALVRRLALAAPSSSPTDSIGT